MALRVALLPFAGTPGMDVRRLCEDLTTRRLRCDVMPEQPLPADAYNPWRQQYNADLLLARAREAGDRQRVLAVTEADLYAADLNFVFGMADVNGRAAVVSEHRLKSDDPALTRERLLKEAMHELGHTLGLPHCPDPACVMYFSNTLADTDRKGAMFCPQCRADADIPLLVRP